MKNESRFLFVGYLVQEPYPVEPSRPDMRNATIDRALHPELSTIKYETICGVANVTRFLTHLPDMARYPGYVLNGYAIDSNRVVPETGIDGKTIFPSKYEYARHWERPDDPLNILGYDVVDEAAHPFSILSSGPYTLDEIEAHAGNLNEHRLFRTPHEAQAFCDYIRMDNQEDGVIWEVWG